MLGSLAPLPLLALVVFQGSGHGPESVSSANGGGPPRGLRLAEPSAAPGYVLFAPLRSRTTFLIDGKGEVVHRWESPYPPLSVYLLEDGTLLRGSRIDENPVFHGGGLGGRIQRLAKDGSVLWEYVLSDDENCLHHDFEPLPNGNVLCIAWEHLTEEAAAALGRDPEEVGESGFWPDWVFELEPTPPSGGKIVWEWHAIDHLIQDLDPAQRGYGSIPDHPERIDVNADHRDTPPMTEEQRKEEEQRQAEMRALGYAGGDEEDDAPAGRPGAPQGPGNSGDWLHANSIDYQPSTDLILLSIPELNEVWIIDHSTTTAEAKGSSGGRWKRGGDLLYRWGNPRMYGMGTGEDQQLFYQHQPEWVPEGLPGAGRVTIFNNGSKRPGGEHSSIDEIELPFDPARGFRADPGQPFEPDEPVWSYSDPPGFYSFFISGCQRLANGNTLVCSGKQGRFFEVTPGKEIVWEYLNPFGGEIEMGMGNAATRGGPPAPPPGGDGPPHGGPPAPPGGPPARPGGGNPVEPTSCFRATKLAPDHPGLKALGVK